MTLEKELAAALEAAARAGELIRREYDSFEVIPDAPANISTHVDRASQELILGFLRDRFPGDGLCAEEATATLAAARRTGPRVWVVDPIDGTRGFARKTGQFSVMIGLLLDARPVLGVVLEPVPNRVTYAREGGDCWCRVGDGEPTRCRVSGRAAPAECVLVQSWTKPGRESRPVSAIRPARVIETYSGGVKLAIVARGEADVYANTYEAFADWDIRAGHILVTEAGGRVTDLSGGPMAYQVPDFLQRRGLLATNGLIHDEVLRRLSSSSS